LTLRTAVNTRKVVTLVHSLSQGWWDPGIDQPIGPYNFGG